MLAGVRGVEMNSDKDNDIHRDIRFHIDCICLLLVWVNNRYVGNYNN